MTISKESQPLNLIYNPHVKEIIQLYPNLASKVNYFLNHIQLFSDSHRVSIEQIVFNTELYQQDGQNIKDPNNLIMQVYPIERTSQLIQWRRAMHKLSLEALPSTDPCRYSPALLLQVKLPEFTPFSKKVKRIRQKSI